MKFRKPSEVGCASFSAFLGVNVNRVVEGLRGAGLAVGALLVLVFAPVLWPLSYLYQNFYGYDRAVARDKAARQRYIDGYRARLDRNDN